MHHDQWSVDYPKLKGVFSEVPPIRETLKQAAKQSEQNPMPVNFLETTGDISKENLDQLDLLFMYTQLLKETLLSIEFEQEHFSEFINFCPGSVGNESRLNDVNRLEREYRGHTLQRRLSVLYDQRCPSINGCESYS